MSASVTLLSALAPEEIPGRADATAALHAWSEPGRRDLRRAGILRGLAPLGTVVWAAGLALVAQRGLEALHAGHSPVTVLPGAALVAGGFALRAALLAGGDAAADRGARKVRGALRARIVEAALPARRSPRGDLDDAAYAEALIGEVDQLTDWLTGYVPSRTAMLLGSGLVLAAIAAGNWFVALLLLAATPLLPANLKVIGLGTRAAVHAQLTAIRKHSTRLLDQIRGLPTLVGLGAQQRAARCLREDDTELAHRTQAVLRVAFLSSAWIELLITGTLAVVATYCGLVLLDYLQLPFVPNRMSLGTALFVLSLTPAYFAPARELAQGYHARAQAAAAAQLITQALRPPHAPEPAPLPPIQPAPGTLGLLLDDVTVRHPEQGAPVLRNVTIDLSPGEVLVVVGPSGAGKSTLLAVAAGLVQPETGRCTHRAGTLLLPADPVRVAWVGQPAHLLSGTLRDNLRLARPDASDTQLRRAFATLGFEDLLQALPHGLDTLLGERGTGLSSGQSQQLVLIRALLREAPLLCLDEPTAHLDPRAEERVITALRTLVRHRTVLLATHSPALLPLADRVLALDDGRPR